MRTRIADLKKTVVGADPKRSPRIQVFEEVVLSRCLQAASPSISTSGNLRPHHRDLAVMFRLADVHTLQLAALSALGSVIGVDGSADESATGGCVFMSPLRGCQPDGHSCNDEERNIEDD